MSKQQLEQAPATRHPLAIKTIRGYEHTLAHAGPPLLQPNKVPTESGSGALGWASKTSIVSTTGARIGEREKSARQKLGFCTSPGRSTSASCSEWNDAPARPAPRIASPVPRDGGPRRRTTQSAALGRFASNRLLHPNSRGWIGLGSEGVGWLLKWCDELLPAPTLVPVWAFGGGEGVESPDLLGWGFWFGS